MIVDVREFRSALPSMLPRARRAARARDAHGVADFVATPLGDQAEPPSPPFSSPVKGRRLRRDARARRRAQVGQRPLLELRVGPPVQPGGGDGPPLRHARAPHRVLGRRRARALQSLARALWRRRRSLAGDALGRAAADGLPAGAGCSGRATRARRRALPRGRALQGRAALARSRSALPGRALFARDSSVPPRARRFGAAPEPRLEAALAAGAELGAADGDGGRNQPAIDARLRLPGVHATNYPARSCARSRFARARCPRRTPRPRALPARAGWLVGGRTRRADARAGPAAGRRRRSSAHLAPAPYDVPSGARLASADGAVIFRRAEFFRASARTTIDSIAAPPPRAYAPPPRSFANLLLSRAARMDFHEEGAPGPYEHDGEQGFATAMLHHGHEARHETTARARRRSSRRRASSLSRAPSTAARSSSSRSSGRSTRG